ncbi:hypothetical protein BGZ65_004283 [Modicella reniformis]|uniref:Uncharacterized protein n=1 Tax=Modicella reniformis TaxID=1440133 RepID=A0A9P6J659_9FUNG|nr:hypothetical protein BGZ65_004283 [Modicella reniformis]
MYSDGYARFEPKTWATGSPEHYLSLPVGGAHNVHSEDLSVEEFAKLAGITILSEDDDDDDNGATSSDEPSISGYTSIEWSRRIGSDMTLGFGSVSSSITMDSERAVTSTIMSNRSTRKINIWDPEFWCFPIRDGQHPRVLASGLSSSSLPNMSICPRTQGPPPRASSLPTPSNLPSPVTTSSASVSTISSRRESAVAESASSMAYYMGHNRRSSYSPCGLRSNSLHAVTFKRVDEIPNPPNDFTRPKSFTSFTAVAIELDNHGPEPGATKSDELDHTTTTPPPIHTKGPNSSEQSVVLSPPHGLAHSVALHALRNLRSMNGLTSGYYRSRANAARTRSPSPSPLSHQIELSDSEGMDSPQEEKDGFELREVLSSSKADSITHPTATKRLPSPLTLNEGHGNVNEREDNDTPRGPTTLVTPETQSLPMNNQVLLMYQHKARSMPLLLQAQHPLETQELAISLPSTLSSSVFPSSSYTSSQPSTPQHQPKSSPARMFTPGTKVGRFTLVQEMCTKHADILRARQDYKPQRRLSLRRASMGDMLTKSRQQTDKNSTRSLDWATIPPMMGTEENVVVFQRKRARRQLPPTPA